MKEQEIIEQMRAAAANESPRAALLVLKAELWLTPLGHVDFLPAVRCVWKAFPIPLRDAERIVYWHSLGWGVSTDEEVDSVFDLCFPREK